MNFHFKYYTYVCTLNAHIYYICMLNLWDPKFQDNSVQFAVLNKIKLGKI